MAMHGDGQSDGVPDLTGREPGYGVAVSMYSSTDPSG
jgi:hypothetical protein